MHICLPQSEGTGEPYCCQQKQIPTADTPWEMFLPRVGKTGSYSIPVNVHPCQTFTVFNGKVSAQKEEEKTCTVVLNDSVCHLVKN